ncbi:uncharacterized protein TrAtP1_002278 [Trichoderma atroviride]|uniref:uncharacterized protein n=1 Tax=Hypocrea atroviridis TaxID=63577 RepID=UPI003332ADBA|nr:hypothetical protein TrAtP1_002278 [Trichoderma atroviride]
MKDTVTKLRKDNENLLNSNASLKATTANTNTCLSTYDRAMEALAGRIMALENATQ